MPEITVAGGVRMPTGILCASDEELAPFLPMIEHRAVSRRAMLDFYTGTISGTDVVVLFCGVCKVNAAIAAQILIDHYGCSRIINAGTAGGISSQVRVFDTIVSTEAVYHDVDAEILTEFHPWMDTPCFPADEALLACARHTAQTLAATHRTLFGRMVTGEAFITDERKDQISEAYAPLSVDMETAGIAHVCYVNQIPFIAVRSVTDGANPDSNADFEANCAKASGLSAEFVKEMLRNLK